MHHPNQYQVEANIRQQERLQQAAAHRAARVANQGRPSLARWLWWPVRLLITVLKIIPAVIRQVPRPGRPKPGREDAPLALDRK